jgi:magnesium chelatase subunit I
MQNGGRCFMAKRAWPRVGDLYTALPGITGKLELEYEGEMKGADIVVRDIVRGAIGKIFDRYFGDVNTQQIEQWFNLGGTVKISDVQAAKATLEELKQIQGLTEKLAPLGVKASDGAETVTAAEKPERMEKADPERDYEQWQTKRSRRGSFN